MLRVRSALATAVACALIAAACGLPDDDYTSGTSGGAPLAGSPGGGAGVSGASGLAGKSPFPDGGAMSVGGSGAGFPNGAGGGAGKAGGGGAVGKCGDGAKGSNEACDGSDLGGATCSSALGKPATGTLHCSASCAFDTTACTFCGDGARQAGEACDGTDFGGASCASVLGIAGATGPLACTSGCAIDTGACAYCGNGKKDGAEQCDGADLGGATCSGLVGMPAGGTPSCSSCTLTNAGCQWCGNGVCDNGETCAGCGDCGSCCYARCCDDALLGPQAEPSSTECIKWGTSACGANGGIWRAEWPPGANILDPANRCWAKCAKFLTYHVLAGVTSGCDQAASMYCAVQGSSLQKAIWQYCQPSWP